MSNRKYLDIDNSIIIHDVKQIKKHPCGTKIKTKNQLSKILFKRKDVEGTKISIYTKLSRYEKDGFSKECELIAPLLKVLEVEEKELVITK